MGRRRPRQQASAVEAVDFMPVSARVAWSYLAAVLASVGAGLLTVVANQTVSVLACASAGKADDAVASCKLGLAIWVTLGGFLLCLVPAVLTLKLGWWLWGTIAAGVAFVVAADGVTEWWWWLAAALTPAVAALASADWARGRRFRRWQLGVLVVVWVGAVAALGWWYVTG